jgi:hypothetical protein
MYRRHLSDCAHVSKSNAWTRCQCPIWVQGSIGGEAVRRSLNTTNWTAASTTVHQWQSSGRVGALKPELPPLDAAIEKFLEEAKTRNLAAETIRKRREFLEGKLLTYCKRKGYRHLRDLTVERLRDFRHGWKYSPSAAKRLEYLRAFCRFCVGFDDLRPRLYAEGGMSVDVVNSIVIKRALADVAQYAADPDNAPLWYENIKSVEWRTPRPVQVGSQIDFVAYFLGRRLAYTYEVVECVPGRRLIMRTPGPPFPMETTYAWEDENGTTRMTLRNRGTPSGFSALFAPLMSLMVRRANRKDLALLKRRLEERVS